MQPLPHRLKRVRISLWNRIPLVVAEQLHIVRWAWARLSQGQHGCCCFLNRNCRLCNRSIRATRARLGNCFCCMHCHQPFLTTKHEHREKRNQGAMKSQETSRSGTGRDSFEPGLGKTREKDSTPHTQEGDSNELMSLFCFLLGFFFSFRSLFVVGLATCKNASPAPCQTMVLASFRVIRAGESSTNTCPREVSGRRDRARTAPWCAGLPFPPKPKWTQEICYVSFPQTTIDES